MSVFDRYVVIGGAAFAGLASLGLYQYKIHFPQTLADYAYLGGGLEIRLNREACSGPLARVGGELNCDHLYFGKRQYLKRLWWFIGRKRNSDTDEINEATNAPDEKGVLSLWGVIARFDAAGRLTFDGKEIGTVRRTTRDLP